MADWRVTSVGARVTSLDHAPDVDTSQLSISCTAYANQVLDKLEYVQ